MRGAHRRSLTLAAGVLLGSAMVSPTRADPASERGRYLTTIMDCGGCHTTGSFAGRPDPANYLAGSDIGWLIPTVGVFYPNNLTPDRETGIGTWSENDIMTALKTGVVPGGRILMPIMPWHAYSQATDADLHAIAAYLQTIPAVHHAVPEPTSLDAVKTPYLTIAPAPK